MVLVRESIDDTNWPKNFNYYSEERIETLSSFIFLVSIWFFWDIWKQQLWYDKYQSFFLFRGENAHFLGLAETESWRVEMYQSCASHLGLDNKIKQMMGFDKLYLLLIKLSTQNKDQINWFNGSNMI